MARVKGCFGGLDDEANDLAAETFKWFLGMPSMKDGSEAAERSQAHAAEYYSAMKDIEQSMINVLASAIYHLYEQHREKLQSLLETDGREMPVLSEIQNWPVVDELRLVANTVKHGEGRSAHLLRQQRPDLFNRDRTDDISSSVGHITPLAGEDLFLSWDDIATYYAALRTFWSDVRLLLAAA